MTLTNKIYSYKKILEMVFEMIPKGITKDLNLSPIPVSAIYCCYCNVIHHEVLFQLVESEME